MWWPETVARPQLPNKWIIAGAGYNWFPQQLLTPGPSLYLRRLTWSVAGCHDEYLPPCFETIHLCQQLIHNSSTSTGLEPMRAGRGGGKWARWGGGNTEGKEMDVSGMFDHAKELT